MSLQKLQEYRKSLKKITKYWLTTNKTKAQKLTQFFINNLRASETELTVTEKAGLLMTIANHHLLAELLPYLHDHENDGHFLIRLLGQQNENGWNLGHFIADHQNTMGVKAYVELLTVLIESVGPTAILALLQQKNNQGSDIGHFITAYQNTVGINAYLKLLTHLAEKEQPKAIIALLQQQDQKGLDIGHVIACYHKTTHVKAYLKLLTTLSQKQGKQEVLTLLQQKTHDHSTLADLIKLYQVNNSHKVYSEFYSSLEQTENSLTTFVDLN